MGAERSVLGALERAVDGVVVASLRVAHVLPRKDDRERFAQERDRLRRQDLTRISSIAPIP